MGQSVPVNSQQLKAAVYGVTRGVSASAVRRVRAIDPFNDDGGTTRSDAYKPPFLRAVVHCDTHVASNRL